MHLIKNICFISSEKKPKKNKKNKTKQREIYIYIDEKKGGKNEKRGRIFHLVEDCLIGWRVTFMCQKLFCQVVHEIGFLRTSERPKYTQGKQVPCFMVMLRNSMLTIMGAS